MEQANKMKLKNQKQQVKAMKVLLEHYQKQLNGEYSELIGCPLCRANKICDNCVWVIESGKDCSKTKYQDGAVLLRNGDERIPKQTLTKWHKRRIKELTNWIKKYDKCENTTRSN